jgi:phage baseplate assembly protein V
MSTINGVVSGIVTTVGKGEVKVKFPWLHENDGEEKESNWARIATTMAGNDRGTFFMPEVGDEVLVAFEQGDFNHPYVVGFLWNGQDKPPADDINKRTIKTTSGHILEFDDNTAVEKITIKSPSGQMIKIADTPPGSITISTKNPGACINIDTVAGTAKIDCLNATILAKTNVTIQAPMITFGGTVQAPLLQAGAVISGSYNSGVPGNIFGL